MQKRRSLRKYSNSAPKSKTSHLPKSQKSLSKIKQKKKDSKAQKQSSKNIQSEYFTPIYKPATTVKKHQGNSKKLLKRPSHDDIGQKLSAKVLNQLTGKVNEIHDNMSKRNKKILNLKLDKAFLQIQILNNQSSLHKAQKDQNGSYGLQTIYNLSKQIQNVKSQIRSLNENNDELIHYQRFLQSSLNQDIPHSEIKIQPLEYSSKEKISSEFLNAIQQLRIVQLSIDKHNQIYEPYISKLKKEISIQKEQICEKEEQIKQINQIIFAQQGKKVKRNNSETSSNLSRASSTRRRNQINTYYCGNLVAKNRSILISDKKLLQKVDVIFYGLKIGFNEQFGFAFQSQYVDDRGQICEGQLHSPNQIQTTDIQMTEISTNRVSKIVIEFSKKINTIQFQQKTGLSKMFGWSHNHLQRKQFSLMNKRILCVNSYWNQGLLIGVGFQYQKAKTNEGISIQSQQYFG